MDAQFMVQLLELVEQVEQSKEFVTLKKSQQDLERQPDFLAQIKTYKENQQRYTNNILSKQVSGNHDELLQQLQKQKATLLEYHVYAEYTASARHVERFIDRLNYEINNLVLEGKGSCK